MEGIKATEGGSATAIYAMKKSMQVQERQAQEALQASAMQQTNSQQVQQAFAQATGRGNSINIAG